MKGRVNIFGVLASALLVVACSEPCDGPCDGVRTGADTGDEPDVFVPREGSYQFNLNDYHDKTSEELCELNPYYGWGFSSELTLTEEGFSFEFDDYPVTFENCVLTGKDFVCDTFESEMFSLAMQIPEGQGTTTTLSLSGKWTSNGVFAEGSLEVIVGSCTVVFPTYLG